MDLEIFETFSYVNGLEEHLGTGALKVLEHVGNRTLEVLGHSKGSLALEGHLGTQTLKSLGYLGTWALGT